MLLVLKEAGRERTLILPLAKDDSKFLILLPLLVGMGVKGVHLVYVVLRNEPMAYACQTEILLTDLPPLALASSISNACEPLESHE